MEQHLRIRRYISYLCVGLAIALLCLSFNTLTGWTQEAAGEPSASPDNGAETTNAPPSNPIIEPLEQLAPAQVRAFFDTDEEIQVAFIYLDGRPILGVTAPADGGTLPATQRAQEIEQQLERIAQRLVDSGSIDGLEVTHSIDEESNQPVITVNGETLMTVTYLDAQFSGVNSLALRAAQISRDIENALTQYYLERQPEFLWQRLRWALAIFLITLLGSFALTHKCKKVKKRCQNLEKLEAEGGDTQPTPQATSADAMMQTMRTKLLARQRIKGLKILVEVFRSSQIALWFGSSLVVLGLFPYTRWLQPLILKVLRVPFRFLIIILVAYGLIRLLDVGIDRLSLILQTRAGLTVERSQRLTLRLSTFSQVMKGISVVTVCVVALLAMLMQVGVQVAPILTGAGLVGVAISFASQSLIKDIINGFLILLEDQYGVGDVIGVKGVWGFVETMNLRITQLRDTEGKLITVPNGQIDVVENLSKEWSRVDLLIPVGLTADINQALGLIEQIANELSRDGIWGPLILEPPLLLGVDNLDHVGATIRIWIKTQPLKQWDVAREYRRRLKIAFEEAQIPVGVPQQVIHFDGSQTGNPFTLGRTPALGNGTPSKDSETPLTNAQS